MLRELDSVELSEWMAYDNLEPLPDSYWQAGMLASQMTRLWSKARTKPQDFMPKRRRPTTRRQSGHEQLAILRAITARMKASRK